MRRRKNREKLEEEVEKKGKEELGICEGKLIRGKGI